MKAVTTEQMRQLDQRTIAAGVPGAELMERAGYAVARAAFDFLQRKDARSVLVFAGKGNNGGDAFVVARHLAAAGCRTTLVLMCRRSELQGDALHHFQQLVGVTTHELPTADEGREIIRECQPALIIDGLLGTGLKGAVREPVRSVIQMIVATSIPVIAIDIPSGLDSDTGEVHGICLGAATTVTMGLPKIGLLQPAAADYVGRIEVADLGFPPELVNEMPSDVELITGTEVAGLLPRRRRDSNKGNYGHLLIIAGSEGFTGAPVICSQAAARSGAGLVTLAVPRNIYPIVAAQCAPEVMPQPLDMVTKFDKFDAIAIGPGLGQSSEAAALIAHCFAATRAPIVVDADALNALAANAGLWDKINSPVVLTPHPGEMGRLVGKSARDVQQDRWGIAKRFVAERNVTLVLKGAGTVVTDQAGKLWINPTGNPGMAKGGMGDGLTGIIGALLGQGLASLAAAQAGVYLHGLAGDLAAQRLGETSLLVTDLIESLGEAFKQVLR